MTKHEALATAHRLLEHAGPKTEILIKAEALRLVIGDGMPPSEVARLREVVRWGPGQAEVWLKGDPVMAERYVVFANALEAILPPPTWKVLAYRHGGENFENWAYPSEIEARQQAHWAITEGYLKVEIEAP